jgi:acyl-homoserine lactone acylase PvdQ
MEHLRETPEGRLEYEYERSWYPADVRTESISVKGRVEPVEIEVVVTRHGPIVEGDPRQSPAERFEMSPAGLDEGLLSLFLYILVYMEILYR